MQSSVTGQSLRSRQRRGGHWAGAVDAAGRAARTARLALPGPLPERHPTLGRRLSDRAGTEAQGFEPVRANAPVAIVTYRRPLGLNECGA